MQKLKRVSLVFHPEIHEALRDYATRSGRSMSDRVSVVLEDFLLKTGDLKRPIIRAENRGGARIKTPKPPDTDGVEASGGGDV